MKKHTLKDWFLATRPWSFPASAMPIIVTLAFLYAQDATMNWWMGLWALIGMVLFHTTGNVWSDYFDYIKKVDTEDTHGATSLTSGQFQPNEIRNFAIGLLVVSVLCGLGILFCSGITLLYIGLAGVVLTLLYPFLKYNALGDLDIVLTFAFLPTLGVSYVVTGAIDWNVLYVALPIGLITDAILHSNNTRDMQSDKQAGIVTLAMSMGKKSAAWLYGFEVTYPAIWVGSLVVGGIFSWPTLLVLLTIPMSSKCAKTMIEGYNDTNTIAALDMRTAQLQTAFSVALSIGFVISKFIA